MTNIFKVLVTLAVLTFTCQSDAGSLTVAQKAAIADSAKIVVEDVITKWIELDLDIAYKSSYSHDSDSIHIEHGVISSFKELKQSYTEIKPLLEWVENKIEKRSYVVLGQDAVAFALQCKFKIKAKGMQPYNGQYVWSGIVQRRAGDWKIIQTHESMLNAEQFIAAITPPPAK